MKKNIFMFDVESTELYGKGFAFSAIVSDIKGNLIDTLTATVKLNDVKKEACEFVLEKVIPAFEEFNMKIVNDYKELRTLFYNFYMKYKDDCMIFSDCNYPVETKFLADIVTDDEENRKWNMPYPLYDACNFIDVDVDRAKKYEKDNAAFIAQSPANRKLKQHNPNHDCVASIHCLKESKLFKEFLISIMGHSRVR